MSQRRILIIGGSTRAAADSVRRAGWRPICADLFADLDLKNAAQMIPVRSYPDSLPDDIREVNADGWFYCGALENHPCILERIERMSDRIGPLLGTFSGTLRLVRDPKWIVETLEMAGIAHLGVLDESSPPAQDGHWMQKPLASAGGRSIRIWDATVVEPIREPHYFQRRAPGTAMSAIFEIDRGQAHFSFASRELQAHGGSRPPSEFAYCGSIGPLVIAPIVQTRMTDIMRAVVNRAPGLQGLVGLDFRLDGENLWLTEINPRYTASVEVAELTSGRSVLNRAISPSNSAGHDGSVPAGRRFVAKQILYAPKRFVVPELQQFSTDTDVWQVPIIADIPVAGTTIETGWPICTVLAEGGSESQVGAALDSRRELVKRLLDSR